MKNPVHAGVAIAAGVVAFVAGPSLAAASPQALLEVWQSALAAEDHATYLGCLHSAAQEVPEYASREAMRFWAHEIEQLGARGFTGQFALEPATEVGARWPAGSLLAYPIVDGSPTRDAIVLVQEAGEWKILRLFS